MTVSTTSYLIQYSGDGGTTAFATNFEFIADSDLVVQLTDSDGVVTDQTITTNYTVAGAGVDAGGTVTMLTAPAAGETLTIYRDTGLTQGTDYTAYDTFPEEAHEQALDKLTLIAQEVDGKVDRALQFLPSEDRSGGTKNSYLPSPTVGTVLAWDANGNIENVSFGTISYDLAISSGDAGKPVGVNAGETGIEPIDALPAGYVVADSLASDSVTTPKIADNAVTAAKAGAGVATFYESTDPDLTDYPVGSVLLAAAAAGTIRNATVTVYYVTATTGVGYQVGSGTALLSGTWKARGWVDDGGGGGLSPLQLVQRVV